MFAFRSKKQIKVRFIHDSYYQDTKVADTYACLENKLHVILFKS